jgi:hypothetical protein
MEQSGESVPTGIAVLLGLRRGKKHVSNRIFDTWNAQLSMLISQPHSNMSMLRTRICACQQG